MLILSNSCLQIYILLYKEVAIALKINSVYSKKKLLDIHENVRVLRYPDHFSSGVYLWYAVYTEIPRCSPWRGSFSFSIATDFASADSIFSLLIGPTMKNLSLLITMFALLVAWICALGVMTHLNTKWGISLLWYGLGRTSITQGMFHVFTSGCRTKCFVHEAC